MNSLILHTAAKVLVALMLVFSVYMLFRGHNEPGGGFIGGLIAAIGFALYAVSNGAAAARRAVRVDPLGVAMTGLGVAAVSGLWSAAFGEPLFTAQWWFLGGTQDTAGVPIGSVILFDIGVYLTVVGAVLSILLRLEAD